MLVGQLGQLCQGRLCCKAGYLVIAVVHAEQQPGLGRECLLKIRTVGAIGGAYFYQLAAGLGHNIRHSKASPNFN